MDTSISSFPPLVYAYLKQVSKLDEEIKCRTISIIETLMVDVGTTLEVTTILLPTTLTRELSK